jgi:four helix bundle protein
MMPYERFHAWRACHSLAIATYHLTEAFPKAERYGLTSQMRRAAFSAAANIAEGSAKRGSAELRRHLDVSLGSLAEIRYAVLLAKDLRLLTVEAWKDFDAKCDYAGKLTMGLYKAARMQIAKR